MNHESSPETPFHAEFPYTMDLLQLEISKIFNVSSDRAREIFVVAYPRRKTAQETGNFKYEIRTNVDIEGRLYPKVMIITRAPSGYQIVLGETTVNQVVPETQDKIPIPEVILLQKFRFQPDITRTSGRTKKRKYPKR